MQVVFTIAQNNTLPHAYVLQESFKQTNSTGKFIVCLLDEAVPHSFSFDVLLAVSALTIPGFEQMKTKYTTTEMYGVMKPFFVEFLLNQYDSIFYFDVKSQILGDLSPKFDLFNASNIILIPQLLKANSFHDEKQVLNSGMFSSGCFGIKKSAETSKMLAWWQSKMQEKGGIEPEKGYWSDQIWLNHVPIFFKKVYVDKSGQLNAGLWINAIPADVLSVTYAKAKKYPQPYLKKLDAANLKYFEQVIPAFGVYSKPFNPTIKLISKSLRAVGNWVDQSIGKVADMIYN